MNNDISDDKSSKSATKAQKTLKQLQKTYATVLTDLFTEHAPKAIESALECCDGNIGGDIHSVLDRALQSLHSSVLQDLGMESVGAGEAVIAITTGGVDTDVEEDIIGVDDTDDSVDEVEEDDTEEDESEEEDEDEDG